MNRKFFALAMSVLVGFGAAFARDLVPNRTHAVLNVTYTNYDDVPQSHKKLTFVGQNNPKNKLVITTDQYGEASFHIPREETYTILCESLTGPFECGNTPYVSKTPKTFPFLFHKRLSCSHCHLMHRWYYP